MAELNGTERAVFGLDSPRDVAALMDRYLRAHLDDGLSEVTFRAGRIDAVWGLRTATGRDVVVKAHRRPVDLDACAAARAAQRMLVAAGFPCPRPISGPDEHDGVVLSCESLLIAGAAAPPRTPAIRRAIARGLARHIDLLRGRPELLATAGAGPAWCRYQDGPWPTPHDSIFDFTTTPGGFEWLDAFAAEAATRIVVGSAGDPVVVGHGDWYAGNLRFAGDRIVASYDWDLVATAEPVLAGFTAGSYTCSATSSTGLATPGDVTAFLVDYERIRDVSFTPTQQRTAAAAAAWVVAYNGRCELSLLTGDLDPDSDLAHTRARHDDYLAVGW